MQAVFTKYLSVPYVHRGRTTDGWDCYGLYRHVLFDRFGYEAESYEADYPSGTGRHVDAAITGAFAKHSLDTWERVQLGSESEGCAIVFNVLGQPLHCGYVITPGTMLHAMHGRGTCIERYDSQNWIKRIEGIYKWNSSR